MSRMPIEDTQYVQEHQSLAAKYGLNFVQFQVLLLVQDLGGSMIYDEKRYHGLTGQPGQTLRAMVARGWLSGPGPKEKPRSRAWALTEEGERLLDKIKRRIRPPQSLTPDQYEIIKKKGAGETGFDGFHQASFNALIRHGILTPGLQLTDMGREAYDDLLLYEKRLAAQRS